MLPFLDSYNIHENRKLLEPSAGSLGGHPYNRHFRCKILLYKSYYTVLKRALSLFLSLFLLGESL